jgi:tetratricopeptide (TPR) repeat protein
MTYANTCYSIVQQIAVNMSAAAVELKAKANDLFKSGQYVDAIEPYTQAIELDPRNAILYRYYFTPLLLF